ncbi:hypothetical protein HDE76_004170 [Rhodanobacter sp. ANJX3]|jgi:hypothetical protein|uniref:hypothetical protein n=1 Tax=unclassified Rhodanobacter TaxID=2621553 RepID=UPI0015CA0035|nr:MULTISPECIES: hypothetical protein [unclassified Rhodanobacter]MBB5360917.1 hypothetical protein [Rhodanobacter sp. ANJX3]NYE31055.1 hypothetical protein [Rhodanobacter sp. K2T2]
MKTHAKFRLGMLGLVAFSALVSGTVMAQDTSVPGHPRVNEVNQRLSNQQNRIQNGEANGTINGKQAARDEKQDANIAQRESADEAKHNGHLTKGEDRRLNKSENRDSRRIRRQKH